MAKAGETEDAVVQDEHHSGHSVQGNEGESGTPEGRNTEGEASVNTEEDARVMEERQTREVRGEARRARIKWPRSVEKHRWESFDEDLDQVLEHTLGGAVERKIEAMARITYNIGEFAFGVEEKKKRDEPQNKETENRREKKIKRIRKELRQTTKAFKKTDSEEERAGYKEIRDTLRTELKSLRRAERSRKRRRKKTRARKQFVADPYNFTRKLLGKEASGRLNCPIEEVENHLKDVHSDEHSNEDLGEWGSLLEAKEPEVAFDSSEPRLKEIQAMLKKARSGSAPGPNGITYQVYKKCPRLTRRLWRLLRVVWRKSESVSSWSRAEGCFIPKQKNAEKITEFRTISLLNVEGKIYMAVLAKRLTTFMLSNKYIDTSVQKGGVPEVPGCEEHTAIVTEIIKQAKASKGELAVIWLDLANAYGTIPHKLIEVMLQRYHVPEKVTAIVMTYLFRFI